MTELPDILGEDLGYLLGWVALGETLGDDDGCEAARAMGAAIVGHMADGSPVLDEP